MLERIIKRHSKKITVGLMLAFMALNVAWDWNTTNVGKKDNKRGNQQESKKNEGWFGCSRNEMGVKNLDTQEDISLKKVIEDYGTRSEIKYKLIAPINSWYGSVEEEVRKSPWSIFSSSSNLKDKYVWEKSSQVSSGFLVTCEGNIQHSSMMDSADGIKQVFLVPHLLKMNRESKKELDAYIFVDEDFYKNKDNEIVYGCIKAGNAGKSNVIKLNSKKINGIYSQHIKFTYDPDSGAGFFQVRGHDSNGELNSAIAEEQ
jgi:hypothetical protein